jgi:hypothetical protein
MTPACDHDYLSPREGVIATAQLVGPLAQVVEVELGQAVTAEETAGDAALEHGSARAEQARPGASLRPSSTS